MYALVWVHLLHLFRRVVWRVGKKSEYWVPMQETRVWSLGQEDPLEKGMATHSSILAWKIPWTEEPGWLQSMGSQIELDTTEWLTWRLKAVRTKSDWLAFPLGSQGNILHVSLPSEPTKILSVVQVGPTISLDFPGNFIGLPFSYSKNLKGTCKSQ